MAAQDAFNPGQEAASVTASPNIQAVQAQFDPNGSAHALVTALGADSTQRSLEGFQQAYHQQKIQEQSLKIDSYRQQFMDDNKDGGGVSQAQLKQRFPEMVPVIAARVAESIGKAQGAKDIAATIEKINSDDSLRLDTTRRAAFIANARASLFSSIPAGNDFYAAGVVSAMDRAFGQEEQKWQGQTAAYHEQVQKTSLSDEAVAAFQSADPKAALAAIDTNYGSSSSLNNVERNKVYVDSVIKLASVSDDPSVLSKIPNAYLNIDSKAMIRNAEIAITGQQWAKFTRAKEFEAYQRDEGARKDKLQILETISNNGDVNPAQYLKNPESHAFAVAAMSTARVPEAASQSVLQAFRTSILGSGQVTSLGSQQDLVNTAMKLTGINPSDKAALVKEIPELMKGTILMNDPTVHQAFSYSLASRLDDLSKSPSASIQRLMGTGNLRGNATAMYEGEIRGNFDAAYKSTGQWPTGIDARKIVDAAVAKTSAYVDKMTSIEGLRVHANDAPATPAAAPKAAAKATPTGLPKGVTLIK